MYHARVEIMKRKPYCVEPLEKDVPRDRCRRWKIRVSIGYDRTTGKRIRPSERVEGTESDAIRRALQIAAEYGVIKTTDLTVSEFFGLMYLPWAQGRVRKGSYDGGSRDRNSIARETYRNYEQVVATYIVPLFGHIGLADLKPYYVEMKLAGIERLGARRNVYKTLRQGYRRAVKWQLVSFVVTDAVAEPKPDPAAKPTVKSDGIWEYIDAFDNEADRDVQLAVAIGFGVGLRRSEVLAIDKDEIDWSVDSEDALGAVRVWRSYHFRKGVGWFEPPKSFSSARTVHFPRWLGELIRPHAEGSGPLLEHGGERTRPDRITKRWEAVTRAAGLPVEMPFKNTRHSCGTMLVREDGLPISDVQQLLGHSTPVITDEYYVQKGTESTERAAAAMNRRARSPKFPKSRKAVVKEGSRSDGEPSDDRCSSGETRIIRPIFKRAGNG